MSNSVKIRSKTYLPGAGVDAQGNPSQTKQRVVGKINVTNYSHGGETLRPRDVNLRVIDYIDLKVDEAVGGNDGGQQRLAHWSRSAEQFYVLVDGVQVAATADPVISFVAEGDSVDGVELT